MVHGVEHLAVHSFLELLQVNHEPGPRIDFPLHRNFEHVVVPVSVGVIALAEQAPVLLRREFRVMVIMRRGEFSFAGEIKQGVPQRIVKARAYSQCEIRLSPNRRYKKIAILLSTSTLSSAKMQKNIPATQNANP